MQIVGNEKMTSEEDKEDGSPPGVKDDTGGQRQCVEMDSADTECHSLVLNDSRMRSSLKLVPSHATTEIPCSSGAKAKEKGGEKQTEIEKLEDNIQETRVRDKKVGKEKICEIGNKSKKIKKSVSRKSYKCSAASSKISFGIPILSHFKNLFASRPTRERIIRHSAETEAGTQESEKKTTAIQIVANKVKACEEGKEAGSQAGVDIGTGRRRVDVEMDSTHLDGPKNDSDCDFVPDTESSNSSECGMSNVCLADMSDSPVRKRAKTCKQARQQAELEDTTMQSSAQKALSSTRFPVSLVIAPLVSSYD